MQFLKSQVEDVEKSKAELLELIQDLTKHMRQQFTERFAQINQNFGADLPGAVRRRRGGAFLHRRQRRAHLRH